MTESTVGRRGLLAAGGGGLTAALVLSGCDLSTDPASEGGTKGDGRGGDQGGDKSAGSAPKEAPMLVRQVKEGKLPPVEERLPDDPPVVKPCDRAGDYGSEFHLRLPGTAYANDAHIYYFAGYENLVRWDPKFTKIIPGVAHKWTANDQGTEFTFWLRQGIKWADGKPFTADDVVFATEDVVMNSDINPIPQFGAMRATKVDDLTVKLTFDEPNGSFLSYMATRDGRVFVDSPRHYLKQFHKKYNPDVAALAKKEKFDNWVDLFVEKRGDYSFGRNPEKPTLYPWLLTKTSNAASRAVLRRNPYYWKVDPDGRQLPYLDRIVYTVVEEDDAALLKYANGEFDYALHEPRNKPVLARSRDKGDYDFFDAVPGLMNEVCVYFNLVHNDPVKRKIFNSKDFRIGLSHAINRPEIIRAVFQRQGDPWQAAPRKESTYFDEEMAKQYTEHDVAKANHYLDRAFPDKDAKGVRLGPDGKPISFTIEFAGESGDPRTDVMELVADYWKKVGVDARLRHLGIELAVNRGRANKHDVGVWSGEGGLDGVIELNPYNYLPYHTPYCFFGVPWADWHETDGKEGEEPPPRIKRQLRLWDELNATVQPPKRHDLMARILQMAKENFFVIGISRPPKDYGTIANRIGNWPEYMLGNGSTWVYVSPASTNPCQLFAEQG